MAAPDRAFPKTATIEHWGTGTGVDENGDPTLELLSMEDSRCNLQPQWSRENTANEAQESRSWNLYLPAGVALGAQDRVEVDGMVLEASGEGKETWDFSGRPHHVEATLRQVL